ncbi:dihydroxyacetone kinase family protein [Affinibrenneria salicis]|uniref:Dihydroxyacetone kinase family protein n=1 Tax=Affinibrenneria salicis TaxID=2590031 RepID=A0A5J5G675_9GAMM|nr:dihydroxyacetone kinase family protein [Affinibrenneria salicis]KAA9002544.1 dihydroxyacetone kinase family protein [Affinibrenneria salicis]KAA9003168.1 dihydroxyacetone kinase family protein [Affinibrenneria salicis]
MTYLFNQPSAFARELTEGLVAAHADKVRQVPGGVVRSTRSRPGDVAIVIGGGSGHYPAFAGLVGQGLAHGAAMGNLFASPSAQQICSVAKAAHNGGGILLAFGNYAGDVLHFGQAHARLQAEGIPCRLLAVTDDISSAPADERDKRRGVAGDLVVFKVAAAAAEAGCSLDEVAEIAARANARTRSLGVAFSGCTLPGADQPLFTIPAGIMALGMGIHGEPGIQEGPIPAADELADLLVTALLNEAPSGDEAQDGQRVCAILNGLGGVKYEELFVVYRRVAQRLAQAGLTVVEPEVGELVTSFDMAGLSLTLCWLDDELQRGWQAPANTPAFRKGSMAPAEPLAPQERIEQPDVIPVATRVSRRSARCVSQALDAAREAIVAHAAELGRIDAVAGDGDHGIGMERGVLAAAACAQQMLAREAGAGTLLQRAADAWADRAGGTSGAIWGVALNALGTVLGDELAPDARRVAEGVRQACASIMHFGKARPGDKTLVDALIPFSDALSQAVNEDGAGLPQAWRQAAARASQAAEETARLLPRIGRARPLAQRSLGTPDAGAVSLALILNAVADIWQQDGVEPSARREICDQ